MDVKVEQQIKRDKLESEKQFRLTHNVSQEEWNLAEEMTQDLVDTLVREFWEVYANAVE